MQRQANLRGRDIEFQLCGYRFTVPDAAVVGVAHFVQFVFSPDGEDGGRNQHADSSEVSRYSDMLIGDIMIFCGIVSVQAPLETTQ